MRSFSPSARSSPWARPPTPTAGELARSLVAHGVGVGRIANLPDHPDTVAGALRAAGVVTPAGRHAERRLAFPRGRQGADRAAIAGAGVLHAFLRGLPER